MPAHATLGPLTRRSGHAQHLARDGRAAWARVTGHGRRIAAEWTFARLKRVLGTGLRTRNPGSRPVEARVAAHALNRAAKGRWTRIGIAVQHDDEEGWTPVFDVLLVISDTTRLAIRERKDKV
ncbi:MAG TPA: hypothetical protein VE684_01800 [Crenalkalicoccus sp.]|nr:hypothetical protein [Crenalkalicoccus sp.]